MKATSMRLLAICSCGVLGACAGDPAVGPKGPRVEIAVAPLTLPNVQGVEYALAVFNASPATAPIFNADGTVANNTANLVWQQDSVTSNQFGNDGGGDISYVGPCDASLTAPSTNWVALALKQVYVGTGLGSEDGTGPYGAGIYLPLSKSVLDDQNSANGVGGDPLPNDADPDFDNPCTYDDPCVLSFPCTENTDTPVVFNLTIMRDANQGFFDIAVNFEDIFCSAKVDCSYDDAGLDPIKLLFNADGVRDLTAVFAVACTDGAGNTGTVLHMNGPRVDCGTKLGTAMTPVADVATCGSNGDLYGSMTGSTPESLATTKPVSWTVVDSVKTAYMLPLTAEKSAGVVAAALDANALVGLIGWAASSNQTTGELHNGSLLGAGATFDTVAVWTRASASAGEPWALAQYALPNDGKAYALSADNMKYESAGQRLWVVASYEAGSTVFYLQKNMDWSFAQPVPLAKPVDAEGNPYAYCSLSQERAPLHGAVGQCGMSATTVPMGSSQQRLAYAPTSENVGFVWEADTGTIEVLSADSLFSGLTPDWTAVKLYVLGDNVIGTAWASVANVVAAPKVGLWTFATGAWSGAEVTPGQIMWINGNVVGIEGDVDGVAVDLVWRRTVMGAWDRWGASQFTSPPSVVSGYADGKLFGLAGSTGSVKPWVALLPTNTSNIVMAELPLPSGTESADFAYVGKHLSASGLTLLYEARIVDGLTSSSLYTAYREDEIGWYARGLTDFAGSRMTEASAIMTIAEEVQACGEMIGSAVDAVTHEQHAATWEIMRSATSAIAERYPKPTAFLETGSLVGDFQTVDLDPTIEGNAYASPTNDPVWQYAIYKGDEALLCDGVPCQKVYWNTAIGFDPTVAGCHLIAEATAASDPGLIDGWTPAATTYPLITVDVLLTSTPDELNPTVELLCHQNPLNGTDSGVQTTYTSVDLPEQLCYWFDGTTASSVTDCTWTTPYVEALAAQTGQFVQPQATSGTRR